jgi:hypothetical protein
MNPVPGAILAGLCGVACLLIVLYAAFKVAKEADEQTLPDPPVDEWAREIAKRPVAS